MTQPGPASTVSKSNRCTFCQYSRFKDINIDPYSFSFFISTMNVTLLSLLVLAVVCCAAHGFRPALRPASASRSTHLNSLASLQSLLTAVAEVKPDGYVYGAVAAPDFVLPLAAVLAVLTAAIPVLLKPGEKALEDQRNDEQTTNNVFGDKNRKGGV
jgi:hypothetical protein